MHIICEYDAGKKSIVRNVRGEPIKKNQERERKREREREDNHSKSVILFSCSNPIRKRAREKIKEKIQVNWDQYT